MKNTLLLILFLVIAMGLVSLRYFIDISPENESQENKKTKIVMLENSYINGVWDWKFLKRENIEDFLKSLKSRGISVVYLDINSYVDIHELKDSEDKTKKLTDFNQKLQEYISLAHQNGLSVHAVVGSTEWGNASHRYLNSVVIKYVGEFNKNHPQDKISGIQFDIESYNQETYTQKNQDKIFVDFLDTVEQITIDVSKIQNDPVNPDLIELGFAIPYWFDGENGNMEKILWHGESKYVLYHLLKVLNTVQNTHIALMSYRNLGLGKDGVVEHSKNEVNVVSEFFPRIGVFVAQETSNIQPPKTTYFKKEFSYMNLELEKIIGAFESSDNFKGFIFNNADSFLEME